MEISVLTLYLFFSLLRGSHSTPLIRRSLDQVGSSSEEGWPSNDAGAVDSCVSLQNSPICGVNYSVPESLAVISAAIEMEIVLIEGDMGLYRTAECMDAAKEIQCEQRFPRCEVQESGEVLVHLSSLNCEERLTESCEDTTVNALVARGFCELKSSTQEAGGCKSIAEHASEAAEGERELLHCTQDLQRRVTPWMYQLLLYYDASLEAIADSVRNLYGQTCFQHQANFTCQQLGQCSEDGQRIEFLNTYETCENFINCFPSSYGLRDQYDCEHWPHRIDSTTTSPSSPSSPDTISSTWPTPPVDVTMNVVGDGSISPKLSFLPALTAALLLHML